MSSKRAVRRKSCTKKIRHTDQKAACTAIHHMGMEKGLNTYKCKFCGGWHVGHWNRSKFGK